LDEGDASVAERTDFPPRRTEGWEGTSGLAGLFIASGATRGPSILESWHPIKPVGRNTVNSNQVRRFINNSQKKETSLSIDLLVKGHHY
jgi:hypothetical protein